MHSSAEKIYLRLLYAGIFLILVLVPLALTNKFLFPFTFTKALIFKLLIELMVLVFLLLVKTSDNYSIRLTPLVKLYSVWVGLSFVSAILGDNFYLSFWGDMERSEGLVMHLHVVAFLIVLSSVVKEKSQWLFFLITLWGVGLAMAVFAIGQQLKLNFFINTQGERLSSTVGNPGFYASLLIFFIFFAFYLLTQDKNRYRRWFYALSSLLFLYLVYATATRGAMLALIVALLASSFFVVKSNQGKKFKLAFVTILLVVILGGVFIKTQSQSEWIKDYSPLHRLARISLTDKTVQTRLLAWGIAWRGWQDNFILGNGPENFNLAFNRYFDPLFYEDEGSVVWFDRAHNFIFERAVTGGLVGLLAYLAIFAYAFYLLFFKVWRSGPDRPAGALLILLLIAYLFQNLFIFDSIATLVVVVFTLGFINSFDKTSGQWSQALKNKTIQTSILGAYIIVFVPVFVFVTVRPALANNLIAQAFVAQTKIDYQDAETWQFADLAFNNITRAIDYGTYGNQEFRIQLAQFIDTLIANDFADAGFLGEAVLKVNDELVKQLEAEPQNVANYLLAMRHYNFADDINPVFPERALALFEPAVGLSPRRVHLYQEAGYAWVHVAQHYEDLGDETKARDAYEQAIFRMQQALDLNPVVAESYINKLVVYFSSGQPELVEDVLRAMDANSINYHVRTHLRKMTNLAVGYGHYDYANRFLQELHELYPDDFRSTIDLALSYACINQDDQAIEIARFVQAEYPERRQDAENFIASVQAGFFRDAGGGCQQ